MFTLACFLASICLASASIVAYPLATSVVEPVYHEPIVVSKGNIDYTTTNVEDAHGIIKQQTAVGKDGLGGHLIRHTAEASRVDPHSGETAVKHDEHQFHINPYYGQAAAHINKAEGSVNHALGAAAFHQKTHDAKIAPGHASLLNTQNTAAVSHHHTAASHDVHAESADIVHDGVAKSSLTAHKSYTQGPAIGGVHKASSTSSKSFDGPGYGSLHYNKQNENHAYDPYGHSSAEENGYDLKHAYDARVGLGATNELEYSRHAAHDPYGNYAAVSRAKHSKSGGHLAPTHGTVYKQPVVYEEQYVAAKPVVYKQPVVYQEEYVATQPVAYKQPVVYQEEYVATKPVVYRQPVVHQEEEYVVSKPIVYKPPIAAYQTRYSRGKSVAYDSPAVPQPTYDDYNYEDYNSGGY